MRQGARCQREISEMGESAERFPTRVANQTNKKGRDELRNPPGRSLTTRRVSLGTQMLGVDCWLTKVERKKDEPTGG
jgi:hypothetical protein